MLTSLAKMARYTTHCDGETLIHSLVDITSQSFKLEYVATNRRTERRTVAAL